MVAEPIVTVRCLKVHDGFHITERRYVLRQSDDVHHFCGTASTRKACQHESREHIIAPEVNKKMLYHWPVKLFG